MIVQLIVAFGLTFSWQSLNIGHNICRFRAGTVLSAKTFGQPQEKYLLRIFFFKISCRS